MSEVQHAVASERTHPRPLAAGVWWLGGCNVQPWQGDYLHAYTSMYVVAGEVASAIVDTGHPKDWQLVEEQLDRLERDESVAPVRYLFPTHPETTHAGNLGRLCERYPESVVIGDVRDYHLVFPEYEHRFRPMSAGEAVSLGTDSLVLVPAAIRDIEPSLWAVHTGSRTLFPGDGFAYMHAHKAGHCVHWAEEVEQLDFESMAALFAEFALYWTRYAPVEPHIEQLKRLLEGWGIRQIGPGHGLPLSDASTTVPAVIDGLRVRACADG